MTTIFYFRHLTRLVDKGPVSLRQYELVYRILARKQEFLVYFQACLINLRVLNETGPKLF